MTSHFSTRCPNSDYLGFEASPEAIVAAAKKAFETYSKTSREERLELLQRILAEYQKRFGDIAANQTAPSVTIDAKETGQRKTINGFDAIFKYI